MTFIGALNDISLILRLVKKTLYLKYDTFLTQTQNFGHKGDSGLTEIQ